MRKYFYLLVLFFFLICPLTGTCLEEDASVNEEAQTYKNELTNYVAIIEDSAHLLNEEEKIKLMDEMVPLTEFGNVAFVSTDSNPTTTDYFAENYYHSHFSTDSGTIFIIDMSNRKIYLFSDGENYRTITRSKAYSITDNTFRYASNKEYYKCASESLNAVLILLQGGKIAEPMRFTSLIFISLTLSFFLSFLFVMKKSRIKKANDKEILRNCDIQFHIGNIKAIKTGTHRVYSPVSDSSSSSSGGGGGGGGGSSGGGGGHSF